MDFTLTKVEILRRRSKPKTPCVEDWKSYGRNVKNIFQSMMEKVGCRTPYQQSSEQLPLCRTKEKMQEMYSLLSADPTKRYPPPCDTLENLQYRYNDFDWNEMGPEWFWIYVDMPNKYNEILQTKALDVHSLVGNCGGYVGLFLGE